MDWIGLDWNGISNEMLHIRILVRSRNWIWIGIYWWNHFEFSIELLRKLPLKMKLVWGDEKRVTFLLKIVQKYVRLYAVVPSPGKPLVQNRFMWFFLFSVQGISTVASADIFFFSVFTVFLLLLLFCIRANYGDFEEWPFLYVRIEWIFIYSLKLSIENWIGIHNIVWLDVGIGKIESSLSQGFKWHNQWYWYFGKRRHVLSIISPSLSLYA